MKIKFLKKKKKFKKGGLGTKPDIYWRYILSTTVVLFILSCLFGLYLFQKVNKKIAPPVVNIDQKETIRKDRLLRVLDYFKERENKSIEILNSSSPVSDPSI